MIKVAPELMQGLNFAPFVRQCESNKKNGLTANSSEALQEETMRFWCLVLF